MEDVVVLHLLKIIREHEGYLRSSMDKMEIYEKELQEEHAMATQHREMIRWAQSMLALRQADESHITYSVGTKGGAD